MKTKLIYKTAKMADSQEPLWKLNQGGRGLLAVITCKDLLFFSSLRELLTNVLDMVSVLISVVSNTDSVHGQSADESRKAAFALFKKLKVCLFLAAIIIRSNEE